MLSPLLPPWGHHRATRRVSEGIKGLSFGLGPRELRMEPLKGAVGLPTCRARPPSARVGRVSGQGPLRRWRWGPLFPSEPHGWRLHVAVAPHGLTLYLPLPAAPLMGGLFRSNALSSFIASKGPGPSLPTAPPQPLLGDQLLPLDPVVSQLLRLQCHPRQAGKEECGLISAGMCPLGCPQRGEGTETKPTRAQET